MSVEDLKTALADYEDLLTFEVVGDYIRIQVKEFLHGERGKAKWEAINEQIKHFGGEWVGGLGKSSHWKVKRETPHVQHSYAELERIEKIDKQIEEMKEIIAKLDKKLEVFRRLAKEDQ